MAIPTIEEYFRDKEQKQRREYESAVQKRNEAIAGLNLPSGFDLSILEQTGAIPSLPAAPPPEPPVRPIPTIDEYFANKPASTRKTTSTVQQQSVAPQTQTQPNTKTGSQYLLEQIQSELKGTDLTSPAKMAQALREYQRKQTTPVTERARLAGDIESGKIKVSDLKPEQIPWDQLMSRPGYSQVAILGLQDQKKAYDYLVELQKGLTGTAGERQALTRPSFGQGLQQGLVSGLALGVPEVAPGRTAAESAGQFVGQVLGMIPGVAAAGATGGAALAGAAARAVPALRGASTAARIGTGVLQGIGTGATLAPAQEAIRVGLTGEFEPREAARRAAETVATYGAFGGAYPVAQSAVGTLGRQIAQRAPGLAQMAQTVGERVPVAAAVAEGVPAGAIAGFLVGVLQGGVQAVMDEDARGFVPFVRTVAQSTKEEMTEELVEAIAYGISRGLIRPNAADVQRAARAAKQALGESTVQQETTTPETATAQETEVREPVETAAEPETTAQQEEASSMRAQRSEMLRQAMPGIDETAVIQLVRDTSNLSDEEFAAFVQRLAASEAETTTEAQQETPRRFATYEEAQRAIDEYEDQLVAKYGEEELIKIIQASAPRTGAFADVPPVETKATPQEVDELRRLYEERDAIERAEQDAAVAAVIARLPEYRQNEIEPVATRQQIEETLRGLIREGRFQTGVQNAEDLARRVYVSLSHKLAAEGRLPYDFAGDFERALYDVSLGVRSPYGTRPHALLRQVADIVKAITGQNVSVGVEGADRTEEQTIPPATLAEVNRPRTWAWLRERAQAQAERQNINLEQFLQNPNGWRGLLTNPTSPLHRYWLYMKMQEMGKPLPQNVSDLMIELDSVLNKGTTGEARAAEIRQVQDQLAAAIEAALREEPAPIERLLAGEELTPEAATPTEVTAEAEPEAPAAQQATLFDQGEAEQLASYRQELAQIEAEYAEVRRQWDQRVQEVAEWLAKEATKANEAERKAFWQRIKDHGYIGPYRKGAKGLNEDLYKRLPRTVNFLKRKDGVPLDELASDLGYESEDAFVNDIIRFANMTAVTPDEVWNDAEYLVRESPETKDLVDLLNFYEQVEADLRNSIADMEARARGEGTVAAETEAVADTDRRGDTGESPEGTVERGDRERGEAGAGEGVTVSVEEGVTEGQVPSRLAYAGVRPALPSVATTPLPVVKRRDIVKTLEKHFGQLKVGGVRGKGVLGQFDTRTGVIRTRVAEDFPVQMHEIGHKLDQELGLSLPRYDQELLALGEQTTPKSRMNDKAYRRAEGVAEFLRLYLMNPSEAQQRAPNYYAAFEAKLDANPDIRDALEETRELVRRYFSQNPRDKVLSAISINEREPRRWPTVTQLYAQAVDQLAPLDRVVRQLGLRGKLKVDEDPYLVGVLARGWAGKPQTWIERGVTDENFNFISEPLNAILNDVENMDDFRVYLVAKRAKELLSRRSEKGEPLFTVETTLGPGITEAEIDAVIAEFEPKYGQIQQRLVRFQNYLVDELVKSGVLSQEGAEAMKRMNQDYIPFYRLVDENLGTFRFAGAKKFADVGQPIKRIKGDGHTIIDPIESVVKNTYMLLNVATRNKVGRTFIEFVEKHGLEGQLAEKVSTPTRPVNFQLGQIRDVLEEIGVEVNPGDLEKIATIFTPTGRPRSGQNELTIMRDGKREYWQVDPEIYRALLFLDDEATATWVKILGTPARLLRAGAVLSPEFLGSNPVRDQWTAFVNSEYGYVPFFDFAKGVFDAVGQTDLYYKFLASGGAQASLVSLDRKTLQEQVNGYLEELKAKRGAGIERLGYIIKKTANPIDVLRALSEFSELGTRLGEFRRAVEKEGATREGYLRAALTARDVTLDFSRRGSKTQTINQLTAFFNAQLQGIDKTIRVFREQPVRSTVRSTLIFTLPTILLYLMNRNNPYWEEKDQWQKDLFFLIPLPWTADENGHARHFLYLPKGHAAAMVFGSAVERILRWIDKEDPTAFEGLGKRLMEDFLPAAPVPTALMPLIENIANYDFFTDMPVVPVREQRLDPEEQYNVYTSDFARVLGKWLGYSPRKIDNLISGYGGGLGKLLVGEVGGAVMRALETAVEGESKAVARPSRGLAGVPFVKAFARDAAGPGVGSSVDQLYSMLDRAESINRRVKKATQQGEKLTLTEEEQLLLARLSALRKVDRTLQDLRAARRTIENDPNMTGDEKREAINALEMLMTNVARVTLGKHPIEVPVE